MVNEAALYIASAILSMVATALIKRARQGLDFKVSPAASKNGHSNGSNGSNGNGNGYSTLAARNQTAATEAILGSVDKLEKLIDLRFQQQDTKIERLRMDYEGYAVKLTESANGYTDQRMTTLQKAFDELRQSIIGQS